MIKKVAYTLFARLSNMLVSMGVSILISQQLGTTGRGEQAGILLSITILCLFTQVAGGSALVFLTPRHPGKQLISVAYGWVLGSALIGWGILTGLGELPIYSLQILIVSIIYSLWSANSFYLLGKEENNWFNSLNFINALLIFGFLLVASWMHQLNLDDYVISLFFGHGITWIISQFALNKKLEGNGPGVKNLLKLIIKHGGYIQLANLAQLLKYRIHYFFIKDILGPASLGVYSNAIAISEGLWLISRSMATVQFSKVANTENDKERRKLTTQYTWLSLGLTTGALLIVALIPDSLYTWTFGHDFTGIRELLWLLVPAVLALSGSNLISHYFSGIGRNHINFIGSSIGLAVTAGLGYFLIREYGLSGAAMASSVAFVVTAGFHWWMYSFPEKK